MFWLLILTLQLDPDLRQVLHVTSNDLDPWLVTIIRNWRPKNHPPKNFSKIRTTTKSRSIIAERKSRKIDIFLEIFYTRREPQQLRPVHRPALPAIAAGPEPKVGSASSKKIEKKKLERRLSIFFSKTLDLIRENCTARLHLPKKRMLKQKKVQKATTTTKGQGRKKYFFQQRWVEQFIMIAEMSLGVFKLVSCMIHWMPFYNNWFNYTLQLVCRFFETGSLVYSNNLLNSLKKSIFSNPRRAVKNIHNIYLLYKILRNWVLSQ